MQLGRRHLQSLGLLVTAFWLTGIGLAAMGWEILSLLMGWPFGGLILGGGLTMSVVGAIIAYQVSRRMEE